MGFGSVRALSLVALGMGGLFALVALLLSGAGQAAIPASLAFTTMGMLSGAVAGALRAQEERLRRVEERGLGSVRGPAEQTPEAGPPRA